MTVFSVNHITVYRYKKPVTFGEHRLMFRPRDSHDHRLLHTGLTIEPAAQVRYIHDPFGNSIAIASFSEELVTSGPRGAPHVLQISAAAVFESLALVLVTTLAGAVAPAFLATRTDPLTSINTGV